VSATAAAAAAAAESRMVGEEERRERMARWGGRGGEGETDARAKTPGGNPDGEVGPERMKRDLQEKNGRPQ